jgi:lipopolysaccharide transport system permease protein
MIPKPTSNWDLIIRPKTAWFDLHLSDLWRYRDLTILFVWRDFIAQYKQTILGPLWYLIQPLFSTIVFTIIFGKLANISTDGLPPFLFYMAGVTCWNYFAECLTKTSGTFIANAGIFGKVYFPRLTIPVSAVISSILKFGIQFLFFIGFLIFFMNNGTKVQPNAWMLLTPCLLFLMAGLGLGAGIIVSALTTKYRDLQYLVTFGVQLLMYATPVVYPLSVVPDRYKWLVIANPMTPIIEAFRYAFLGSGSLEATYLLYSTAATLVILFVGILLFNRVEKTFMDTV